MSLQVWQQSQGLDWEGQGRDALVERVTADKATVIGRADQLREAATIARRGAGDISAAQRRVLYSVEDAHNAGFVVGEDLSVTDTRASRNAAELAARQSQAQALSADIRARAAQLVGVDSEVGGNITGAAGDVGATNFTETPVTYDGHQGKIQMAGHGFKDDPTLPPPQPGQPIPPQPPAIKLPPRTEMPIAPPIAWGDGPPPHDPSKHHCSGWDVTQHVGEGIGGPLLTTGSILGGIAGSPLGPPEWAMAIGGVLAGIATTISGFNGLAGCE
ncbi:hypothetical protein [Mycobacterium sp. IS-2888]|uniref:hypothetical protein n=1 Tax=Mycobacterium sp. IS-2888 TaxID=1834159 RepID=UPI0011156842|nr:hypothetical protein [Mycobacterium sp. IS-2888]